MNQHYQIIMLFYVVKEQKQLSQKFNGAFEYNPIISHKRYSSTVVEVCQNGVVLNVVG